MTRPIARLMRSADPSDRGIRWSWWWVLPAALSAIASIALTRLITGDGGVADGVTVVLVVAAAVGAAIHWSAAQALDDRRRGEAESFVRILSGLSRSVSPDAIVDAIAEELGLATGADHVVVVRRNEDGRGLLGRLVSLRAGVPDHSTDFPVTDLTDDIRGLPPTPAGIADRIARSVREAYGLGHVMAAPLLTAGGVVGAIVVSRRTGSPWPASTRSILGGAAVEASAALERVYSYRDAEVRASTDALTGLPNRRYFDEYVGLLVRRRRAKDAIGVLMVDIDRFKALNDRYGHATGDAVLRAVAGAILAAVREDDVPARFGGEEFVVLLRNPDPRIAVEVGERIRAAVRGLDLREIGVPPVSVSVGVAVGDAPDSPVAALIDSADRALYRAKRAGRDRVVLAT